MRLTPHGTTTAGARAHDDGPEAKAAASAFRRMTRYLKQHYSTVWRCRNLNTGGEAPAKNVFVGPHAAALAKTGKTLRQSPKGAVVYDHFRDTPLAAAH
jgi:hypothetical protein